MEWIIVLVIAVVATATVVWCRRQSKRQVEVVKEKVRDYMLEKIELDTLLSITRDDHLRTMQMVTRRLHDDIGAELVSAKYMLNSLSRRLDGDDFGLYLVIQKQLDAVIGKTRDLTTDLLPPTLKRNGLDDALRELCSSVSDPRIQCVDYKSGGRFRRFVLNHEFVVYRSVKELLVNARKHSHAWHVYVEAEWGEKELEIKVWDDGQGVLPWKVNANGMGHQMIEGSIDNIRGRFFIRPSKKGFHAIIKYPLSEN